MFLYRRLAVDIGAFLYLSLVLGKIGVLNKGLECYHILFGCDFLHRHQEQLGYIFKHDHYSMAIFTCKSHFSAKLYNICVILGI